MAWRRLPVRKGDKGIGYKKKGVHFAVFPYTVLVLTMLLLAGCASPEDESSCKKTLSLVCAEVDGVLSPRAIQQASAFVQGNALYAKAELNPSYLQKILGLLRHGEPILATYHFRFYRVHAWLPGLRLAHATLKRRLRLRLITRRFEMLDLPTGRIQYTGNPDEAMGFLGAPHYVFLGTLSSQGGGRLSPDHRYRLNVDLTMEYEGMLHLFRVIDQWLMFGQQSNFSFQSDYTP